CLSCSGRRQGCLDGHPSRRNSFMLRKITLAIAAAALVGFAFAPADAFARGGGHGGMGGHGMHVGGGGHFGHFHGGGFRGARFGFYPGLYAFGGYGYPYYGYYDDYYGGCALRRRVVHTYYGPRVRLVRVCY